MKKKKSMTLKADSLYNYTNKEDREGTIAYLLMYANGQRGDQINKWKLYDEYYNNKHKAQDELKKYCEKKNIPWIPAVIPDPYIHVESQINPDMPSFEFSGRDDDTDSEKAKIRQYVCQYVLDNNEMTMKVNRNQRRLNKFGNEIWKVGYDFNISLPQNIHGDIFVHDIDPVNFINDPIAVDLDDGEYHAYVYDLHRIKAARIFRKELLKLGYTSIEEIRAGSNITTNIYSTDTYEKDHDTVQIVEFWFRQPQDGRAEYEYEIGSIPETGYKKVKETVEWEAGDIACSILINDVEIKYIPKYWLKTSKQNKMFPFAIGCKIAVENQFWDKSELEPMLELVDAADREFALSILNDTFAANDIIIMSSNAMTDGSEPVNEPGAIWKVNDNAITKPQRLGGLSSMNGGLKDTVNFIRDIIKQVVGNFDVNMGDAPPGNVRTLGGLVQLKEQGNTRQNKKKAGSIAMWERLLKLIDYTAIEFYDDNRLIFIGAEHSDQTEQVQNPDGTVTQKAVPISFTYNSDSLMVLDDNNNNPQYYYPVIDYKVNVGDGIKNSPAMTIQATEDLLAKQITPQNYKIAESLVDQLNLPNRKEIKEFWNKQFNAPPAPQQQNMTGNPQLDEILSALEPEELKHLLDNPELLMKFAQENGIDMGGDTNV